MVITQLFQIRGKSGSGTSPCCCLTCFMCQMPNVQIEFVELINEKCFHVLHVSCSSQVFFSINEKSQSDYGISCMMYKSIIPLSDYQLYLIPWKFRSKACRYLTWWICQIGLLNIYYSFCVIISYRNQSDMVTSFMLPWTGDITHDAYFKVITTPLCRVRGKAGSGTSLCCRPLCQYKLLNVSN